MSKESKEIFEKLKTSKDCMFTTVDAGLRLVSRPMRAFFDENNFDFIYFISDTNSLKLIQIDKEPEVNLAFVDSDSKDYVSISGRAEIIRDKNQLQRFWGTEAQLWYPEGPSSADIFLISVKVNSIHSWQSKGSSLWRLFEMGAAALNERKPELTEQTKIDNQTH